MAWKNGLGWVLAVAVAAMCSVALGLSQGQTWAAGSANIAYWAERGTGSLGWMDQMEAIVFVWLGGLMVTFVAGIVVGVSASRWRRLGLLLLIALSTTAIAMGFLTSSGYGGASGYPAGEAPSGLVAVLSATMLGSFIGYGMGRRTRRRSPRSSAPA